ncbi:MAG: DNA mismatch repair protein MutL, partial [Dactylosporangium sp.]|nr:DNA mismatch repair protein MutL [Dactylosporangium sp.]NNJ61875.1 DNA mismatch repair protein MutL [Dactylosporangium sp.]
SASPPSDPGQPPASARPSATGRASSSVVVDGWTRTIQDDGTPSYLRGFQVRGGSTVIGMTPGRVYLVSATPSPDHVVEPSQSDPTRLVVRFIGTGRYDIVDAMWWNDAPYAQVSEVG